MGLLTGFRNPQGVDIGAPLVERSYLIDRYPELAEIFRQAGLWTWGNNLSGQLGDGTSIYRSSPVQVLTANSGWKQVSTGRNFSAGIKGDGTLWTWGDNSESAGTIVIGQLGNNQGTVTPRSSPGQTVAGGLNWKQVTTSGFIAAAIKTDNTLWTWGKNDVGQLGNSTVVKRSSPGQTIAGGTNWKQVSVSELQCASVKTDGTLWTWGDNTFGALGNANTVLTARSSPGQTISNTTNWMSVVAGDHVVASIKSDGTLWTWGRNDKGQLGTNDTTSRSSPGQTVALGTNWKQVVIAGGNNFISLAAIKTDGTLWTWGNNSNGELGIASTVTRTSSPGQTITGGTNWKVVAGAYEDDSTTPYGSYSALKTDGTLWTWGSNRAGQLASGLYVGSYGDRNFGNPGINSASSPAQTIAGGTNWKSLAVYGRGSAMAAIRDDSADLFGEFI